MIGRESVGGEGVVIPEHQPEEPAAPTATRQLRLALAMRGGVSLAVWMGGAVSEIERLRRAPSDSIYASLLMANGYDDVIVDVLSGASAGGLNAVVFAAAEVHGFPMEALRTLWLELGDLELLARDTTAGERAKRAAEIGRPISRTDALRPPSLLRGDEYFYEKLRDVLTDRIGRPDPSVPVAERVELLLSATLSTPERVKRPVNATTVIEDGRSNALFRFHHRTDESSDFSDGTVDHPAPARLAMAGRSTSSFPAAFEPARIAIGPGDATRAVEGLDFARMFEIPGVSTARGSYEVIDGGVLDNIPVAAAIDAIVEARADGPTDRWLCYLHPSPSPMGSGDQPVDRPQSRGLATTLRTLATRFNQESVLEDIDDLRLVNDVRARRRLVRDTLLAPFEPPHGRAVIDHVAEPSTARRLTAILVQLEVHRIRSNLERPDRLGLTTPTVNIGRWSAASQFELGRALVEAVGGLVGDGSWAPTLVVANEGIDLLIAFARTIENTGSQPSRAAASRLKTRLYALRARHDHLVRMEAETWHRVVEQEVAETEDGSIPSERLRRAIERAMAEAGRAVEAGAGSLRDDIRSMAHNLAAIDAEVPSPYSLLRAAVADGRVGDVLEAVVLTLLPARLVGRGPWGEISFVYITGDAPVARPFPGLADEGRVGATQKLCGNELGNFAAFLSAKWRANDWMWGRMDAASTLVSALTPDRVFEDRPERARLAGLAREPIDSDPETIREAIRRRLQDEILAEELPVVARTPSSEIDRRASVTDRELTAENLDVGRQTVADLGTLRQVRIGMRLAHLAFGAARPGGESLPATLIRLVLSVIKPAYLAAVFAVLSPALGVLAFAIGVAALQTTFWRGVDDFEATFDSLSWTFVAATVITAVPAGVGVVLLRRGDEGGRSLLSGSLSLLIVAAPAAVLAIVRDQGVRYLSLAVVALAMIALAAQRLVHIERRRRAGKPIDRIAPAWALVVVVAIVGLVVGWVNPFWQSSAEWSDVRRIVLVLLGAAVVVVVLANWWMQPLGLGLAIALTVTTGLGTLQLTEFGDRSILGLRPSVWLWLALVLVALVYLRDVDKLRRYCGDETPRERWRTALLSASMSLFVLAAVGVAVTLGDYTISLGAWSVTSVAAVSYAMSVLATYFPVFRPPQPLDLSDQAPGPAPAGSGRAERA